MYTRQLIYRFIEAKGVPSVRGRLSGVHHLDANRLVRNSPYLIQDPDDSWSDWGMTIPHILVPSLTDPNEICLLLEDVEELDDAYSFYETLIDKGYRVNLPLPIHTKVLKC